MIAHTCNPNFTGGRGRGSRSKAGPSKRNETLSKKLIKAKGAGRMAQVVEHLPGKHEAPNSKPSTIKKKKIPGKTYRCTHTDFFLLVILCQHSRTNVSKAVTLY
jgi:hypothetical protein